MKRSKSHILNRASCLFDLPDRDGIEHSLCRAVGFARHATEKGIADQVELIRQYADATGLKLMGLYTQVQGPSELASDILSQIVNRRREVGDFDSLIVCDFTRLTRKGISHAIAFRHLLAEAGINVVIANPPVMQL